MGRSCWISFCCNFFGVVEDGGVIVLQFVHRLGYETSRGHANLILCPKCKGILELCQAGESTPKGIRFRAWIAEFLQAEYILDQKSSPKDIDEGPYDPFSDV